MITLDVALELIAHTRPEAHVVRRPCEQALGFTLAADLCAPIDIPPFRNSAVDGYAISTEHQGSLVVADCLRAVGQSHVQLAPNTAIKVMTGAPVPQGANAVVMKEYASLSDGHVSFSAITEPYSNVREQGEDIRQGDLFLKRGSVITSQNIGLLYGLGIEAINVFRKPKIKIICTGDELVLAPKALAFGEQYFLMGPMLAAQCRARGIHDVSFELVSDDVELITKRITHALDADIVLLTGGISMGEYDFVREALRRNDVEEIFYKGYWRPGKPLFFGKHKNTHVFALPGNPVSAFVCFRVFVTRLIEAMQRMTPEPMRWGIAHNELSKKLGFSVFARAHADEHHSIFFLPGQASHQIYNLSQANALCLVGAPLEWVRPGDEVSYLCI